MLVVASRTASRAAQLAAEYEGRSVEWDDRQGPQCSIPVGESRLSSSSEVREGDTRAGHVFDGEFGRAGRVPAGFPESGFVRQKIFAMNGLIT